MQDITPGTVVIYTGSFTDHHGPAVFIGPSSDYPPGDEVRYTLIFVGHSRLEGVSAGSFTTPGPDVQIPAEVHELASAIRTLKRDTLDERIRNDAAKTQAFALIRNPERDQRLRAERLANRYAAKFAAETVHCEPPTWVEPTDEEFAARFAGCARVPPVEMYPSIREIFLAEFGLQRQALMNEG